MNTLAYLGRLLLVMACLFGLGALSGLLERPGANREALIMEAALSNTHRLEDSSSTDYVFEYTCHKKVLATYDLSQDTVVHIEDIEPESPFHISLADISEFGQVATGWEAATWARESILSRTTQSVSRSRKVGIFVGAATGFLAGRWFVLARALNCRNTEVISKLKDKLFWQEVVRFDMKNYYDHIAIVTGDKKIYPVMEHVADIERAIQRCGIRDSMFMDNIAILESLKTYRRTLDDAATHVDADDMTGVTELGLITREIMRSPQTTECLFGNKGKASLLVTGDNLTLFSVGPLTKWLRLGTRLFFWVFSTVAAWVGLLIVVSKLGSAKQGNAPSTSQLPANDTSSKIKNPFDS